MKPRLIPISVSASLMALFLSGLAYADATVGGSSGSVPPGAGPCESGETGPGAGTMVRYSYRGLLTNINLQDGACDGAPGGVSANGSTSFPSDGGLPIEYSDYFMQSPTSPIFGAIVCENIDANSVQCLGDPTSPDVQLNYAWELSGPIARLPANLSNDQIRVACIDGQAGTGLVQLKVTSQYASNDGTAYVELICTTDDLVLDDPSSGGGGDEIKPPPEDNNG